MDQSAVDLSAVELGTAIDEALRAAGTPERAEQERRYLRSALEHHGVPVGRTRLVVRSALAGAGLGRRRGGADHDAVVALAVRLWEVPVFDRRRAAVEVLDARSDALSPADLPLVERFLREAGTWALVDDLAARVTGAVAMRHPSEVGAVLDRWVADDTFWVRRAALLALLPALRSGGAPELDVWGRLERYADAMLDEREPFIRKAIGWVLREAGRREPDRVASYVASRTPRMSGLTWREAVRRLPDGLRRGLEPPPRGGGSRGSRPAPASRPAP